jgi:hypothetical protein
MRELAKIAQTEALRNSCLKAAEEYEALAENAGKPALDKRKEQPSPSGRSE